MHVHGKRQERSSTGERNRPWKVVLGSAEFREAVRASQRNTESVRDCMGEITAGRGNRKDGNISGADGTVISSNEITS